MSVHLALATLPLVSLYTRWCSLAKRTPGSLTSWDGCLLATFADPHSGDLVSADKFLSAIEWPVYLGDLRSTALADLDVRADQLQAAGDPRGEWLAIWLMQPSEHRDRAVIDSTLALAGHVQRLIEEHERRARRTKTIPRKGPWSIELGSTLVLRIDGGPDQVVTFRAGDFIDTQVILPHELAAVIDEQLVGGYAEPTGETVEIESATYDGKVEIIGGSAALSLGLYRLAAKTIMFGTRWEDRQWLNVDYSALETRLLLDMPARHGMSGYLRGSIIDDVTHQPTRSRGVPSPYVDIRPELSVHGEVVVKPVDEAALAKMRELFANFATRRAPVSAEVLQAITNPSEPRRS